MCKYLYTVVKLAFLISGDCGQMDACLSNSYVAEIKSAISTCVVLVYYYL